MRPQGARALPLAQREDDAQQALADDADQAAQLTDALPVTDGVQLAQAAAPGAAATGGGAAATPGAAPAAAGSGSAAAGAATVGAPVDAVLAVIGGTLAVGVAASGGGGGDGASGGGTPPPPADTTPPVAPAAALAQDTGASNTDGITSVGTVNVSGLEAGATWQFSTDAGATWVAGSGTSFALAAGSYTAGQVQVRQTDAASNIGAATELGAITVDATAPTLSLRTFDRGAQTITLTYDSPLDAGHPPATGAFSVTTNGAANAVTAVQVTGNQVVLTLQDAFAAGGVTVSYTDAAGDDASAIQDIAGNDAAGFVNGILADGYVRDAQVYIDTNGNGVADPGTDYLVGTTDAAGNFFITAGAPTGALIAVGGVNIDTGLPNTLPLKAPAGSTTINPLTTLVQAVIDAAPTTDAATAAAQVASALGITVPAGQTLTTYDPLAAGDVSVQIAAAQVASVLSVAASVDTAAVTTAVTNLASAVQAATTGSTTVDLTDTTTLTTVLGDATLATTAATVTTDLSNASTLSDISTVQSQAFDTIAPAAPTLSAPALSNAPSVTVGFNTTATNGTAAVAGDTVTVFDGANAVATYVLTAADIVAGQVTISLANLATGSYTLTAQLGDQAGNPSSLSASASLAVDVTAPAAPGLALASDTGGSGSDGITTAGTVNVTGLETGASWQYSTDAGANWANGTGTSFTLAAGSYTAGQVLVRQTDTASNTGSNGSLGAVTVDATAPAAPSAGLANDTGTAADGVTTDGQVNISGLEANATWQYSTDAGANWSNGTGTSFTLAAGTYTAGQVLVRQIDLAGNTGASAALSQAVVVDGTAPAAPTAQLASDTGASSSDGITQSGTINVSGLETGASWQYSTDAGANWTNGSGTSFSLGEASYSSGQVQVRQIDLAGNTGSAASLGALTIDATAPAVAPTVNAVADSADRTPALSGTATLGSGETLSVSVDGTVYTVGDGHLSLSGTTWSLTLTADLTAAAHSVVATVTDTAGNSVSSGAATVNVLPYGATVVNWTAERNDNLLFSGDDLVYLVHFSNPVVLDTTGGVPQLGLVIVDDAGVSHTVQASASLPVGVPAGTAVSSLYFRYTLTADDVGRYHVDKIDLNGGSITSTADNLPANITLVDGGVKTPTGGTYLYGEPLAGITGTAGNEALDPFHNLTTPITSTELNTVDAGGGNRDVLGVPIFLSGVSTFDDAVAYTLRFNNGVVEAVRGDGFVGATFTVPGSFPTGVETLLFYTTFQDGVTSEIRGTPVARLNLSNGVATFTDPVFTDDRFVRGAIGADTIDLSADTSTTSRYVVRGGAGNDTITGHAGSDFVFGDGGVNTINTGGGNDIIFVGRGTDTVDGGAGTDLIGMNLFNASAINLQGRLVGLVVADESNNRYYRIDVTDDNKVTVRDFSSNTLLMTASNMEGLQARFADGGGRRTLNFLWGDSGDNTLTNTTGGQLLLSGGLGNDTLNAGNSGDFLFGGSGNDTLNGGNGADRLNGGAGDDVVNGGAGDDWLVGDAGNDTVDGGTGADTAGFRVGAVPGAGPLRLEFNSVTNQFDVMQGNVELARIYQAAGGGYIVQDRLGGVSSTYFGTDKVTNTEYLTFDYGGNTGQILTLNVADLDNTLNAALRPAFGSISFANNATSVSVGFTEAVGLAGGALAPTDITLERFNTGTSQWDVLTVSGVTGVGTAAWTVNLSGATLVGSNVLRLTYNATGQGNLVDADNNPVEGGQVFVGGGGNNTVDLSNYWHSEPITLRGNGGNDVLVGSRVSDRLVDGGGADLLDGGWGKDILVLVEDGTTTPYAADTIRIGLGQSAWGNWQTSGLDVVRAGTNGGGFDIHSATAANHDRIDLTYAAILANTAGTVDGTDAGRIASHSISGGIVTFYDSTGAAVLVTTALLADVSGYLRANANLGLLDGTGALRYDSNDSGAPTSTLVFQGYGAAANQDGVPLSGVILHGVTDGVLGNTAGDGVIQIVDSQAPEPYRMERTADGVALHFTEAVSVPAGVALSLDLNGTTAMTITNGALSDGNRVLDVHTTTTLAPTDWVMLHYGATDATNAIADLAGNLLMNDPADAWGGNAIGGNADNVIDLSGVAFNQASLHYDLNGAAGNDTLIGSNGDDFLDGGTGADLLTGGAGSDEFHFAQGDSPVISALNLGADNMLGDGDTFSFGNGVDVVTDLSAGEGFNLNKPLSDILGYDQGAVFMGTGFNLPVLPFDGKATNQGFYLVQGNFSGSHTNGSFTVDMTAGTDTLVVYDGDATQAVTQTAIVLQHVTLADLTFNPGSNWVSHI